MRNHLKEDIPPPKVEKHEEDINEIICYYDTSSKYGVGYLLSNGSCGIIFNDSTSLTAAGDTLLYFDGKGVKKVKEEDYNKKLSILKLCQEKLKQFSEKNILIAFESQVVVKKYIKSKDLLVMKLTNGILQFFWGADSVTLRGYRWVRWRIGKS